MLTVTGLDVHYGAVHAVKGVDLEVRAGSVTALLGANGAGKTTTLMAIAGARRISGGSAERLSSARRRRRSSAAVSPWCRRGGASLLRYR